MSRLIDKNIYIYIQPTADKYIFSINVKWMFCNYATLTGSYRVCIFVFNVVYKSSWYFPTIIVQSSRWKFFFFQKKERKKKWKIILTSEFASKWFINCGEVTFEWVIPKTFDLKIRMENWGLLLCTVMRFISFTWSSAGKWRIKKKKLLRKKH